MIAEVVSLDDITFWAPPGSCQRLQMLRLDQIHPVISGNKWFKLQPNLQAALSRGCDGVLSFGGGYSNHLVALAFAAREAGLGAIGIVRGHYESLTPTLQACADFGMELRFVEGSEYARLKSGEADVLEAAFPQHYMIPEGGANAAGIEGAMAIAALIPPDTTDVCVGVGTGTTLAGLHRALPAVVRLHGFCAAKDCNGAHALVAGDGLPERISCHQVADPRFGRWTPELMEFMHAFHTATGIRLDVIYTGKMMQALRTSLHTGAFTGRSIVCIHTGGLQGNPAGLFES